MRAAPEVSRRTVLAALAAAPALLAAGCSSFTDADPGEPVTPAQVDQLAGQLTAHEELVAAYAAAFAASPELAAEAGVLAAQCTEQRDRLRAAAPGATAPGTGTPPPPAATDPAAARVALRERVEATAASHAAAAPGLPGARAALLGSIAAGLRGQARVLT